MTAWIEIQQLVNLAIPSVAANALDMSLWVVDVMMLGLLGRGHLAAGSIGISIFCILWIFIEGFLTSQETLSAQAVGLREDRERNRWTCVSFLSVGILCAGETLVLLMAPLAISHILPSNSHMAFKVAQQVLLLIPALWFMALFKVIEKHFQSQNIMLPSLYCAAVGAFINFSLNYVLMFVAGIGFIGCSLSTVVARLTMLALMLWLLKQSPDGEKYV